MIELFGPASRTGELCRQIAVGSASRHKQRTQWIKDNELTQAARLAEQLKVHEQWQTAVEKILGETMQALVVPDLSSLISNLCESEISDLQLFQITDSNKPDQPSRLDDFPPLCTCRCVVPLTTTVPYSLMGSMTFFFCSF